MQVSESNLDVNIVIQTFQEKLNQTITDLVIKEALVKQLTLQIQELNTHIHSLQAKEIKQKPKKENLDDFE